MEWVVLETAPDQIIAEMWVELLRNNGVPAFVRVPDGLAASRGFPSPWDCGVMVPDTHREIAANILKSILDDKPRKRRK